jgi:hypothetical protein
MYYRTAKFNRLTFLTLLAASLTLSAQAQLLPGEARKILALPAGDSPEGIAVDLEDGAVYVGNRSPFGNGLITSDILKINDDGQIDLHFSSLPMAPATSNGLLGLAMYQGDIFAALDSDVDATQGVYKISRRGERVQRLSGSWRMGTPNALAFDDASNLYVTDSLNGAIWRFDPDNINQPGQLWAQHDLLTPDPQNAFGLTEVGANGIVFLDGSLFVANTSRNLIARVQIAPGGASGATDPVAGGLELIAVDGLAAAPNGTILAAMPGFEVITAFFGLPPAPVVRVDPGTGEVTPIVLQDLSNDIFDVPLSLSLSLDGSSVFVTNGALEIGQIPPNPGPGVVEVGLSTVAAAVPEPSTAVLFLFLVVSFALICQKRRLLHANAQR